MIHAVVLLRRFAGLADKDPGVWTHAAVGHSNVWGQHGNLLHRVLIH